jgi:hypothetical protein
MEFSELIVYTSCFYLRLRESFLRIYIIWDVVILILECQTSKGFI